MSAPPNGLRLPLVLAATLLLVAGGCMAERTAGGSTTYYYSWWSGPGRVAQVMATLWGVMVLAKLRMKPSPYNKFAIFSMYVIGAVVGCAMSADFYTTWTTISADGFQVRTGLFHGLKEYDVKFADLSAMGLESVVVEGPKGPSHCVYMVCRYKDGSKRVEFDVSGNDVGFATRNPLRKAAAACGVPVLGYDGRPDPDFPLPLPLPQAPKADSAGPLPPAPKAAAATSEPSPTKP